MMNFLKNFLLIITSVILTVALVEGACFLINRYGHQADKFYYRDQGLIIDDKALGYKPAPSGKFRDEFAYEGDLVYDVHYTIDEYSRRVTPVKDPAGRNKYALFFGCSHTFGEGLDDNQTLPYFFGREKKDYTPYNYGFMGYGPQQMLMQLYLTPVRKEIPELEGMAFYLYIGHWHVYRAIGEMMVSNGWGDSLPCLKIDDNNQLVCLGGFKTARPILSRIYEILGHSQFVKAFHVTFPLVLTDRHYELTARIIKQAREKYTALFNNDNFYVIISPATHPDDVVSSVAVIPFLKKEGVKYLDYSTLFYLSQDGYNLKGDGHPTALANRTIAKRLAADIRKLEQEGLVP
jgi:hypothetical protein